MKRRQLSKYKSRRMFKKNTGVHGLNNKTRVHFAAVLDYKKKDPSNALPEPSYRRILTRRQDH